MHTLRNIFERILAALTFFTRLPLGRRVKVSAEAYQHVVPLWPLMGWLTGGLMVGLFILCRKAGLDVGTAVVLALTSRVLLTGALHEDGLADFCDGFGGRDKNRTLEIMKDSHIGTYGVIGLILYFLLLFLAIISMKPFEAALTMLAADPFAKMLSAQLVQMMPYARTEETAKNHTVYRKFDVKAGISLSIQGLLPIGLYIYYLYERVNWQLLIFVPAIVMYFLYLLVWRRLRGYTGDCCGALCLITELATVLVASYCLS